MLKPWRAGGGLFPPCSVECLERELAVYQEFVAVSGEPA